MFLKAPWVKYLIIGETEGHFTYIIPCKDGVVIGGTLQTGIWSMEVDPSNCDDILERCFKYIPTLVHSEVFDEWVGLRPYLSSNTAVVHNYRQGGKGLAFSFGCAKDCKESAVLTEKCLSKKGFI